MSDTAAKPADAMSDTATGFDFRAMHGRIGALLDRQIFFLGGAVKSGTTWLQALLDAHPQVSCTGENHFVDCLSPTVKKSLEEHNRILLDPRGNTAYQLGKRPMLFEFQEFLYVLGAAMLALLLRQAGGKAVLAVGDKTTVNVQAFGQLAKLFPGSKHVHILRDPRDGAVSGWHHVSRLFPEETREKFPAMHDYVKHYADVWALEVERGVAFGAREPDRYLEVRYEDLVAQTASTLAAIFRFLGVDPGDDVVRTCIETASFERLSGGRARGQENAGSFFRKGIVGDWKTRLDPASAEYVVATCGPLMTRFGYL